MKIALLSDLDGEGGAAVAANHLESSLRARGHDVLWVGARKHEHGTRITAGRRLGRLQRKYLTPIFGRDLSRTIAYKIAESTALHQIRKFQPHICNVHNIHGEYWRPQLLEKISKFTPIVWTLHDMWSFTGRCVYNMGCNRYLTGCNEECPTADEYPSLPPLEVAPAYQAKKALFSKTTRLTAVCPSQWLADQAKKGLWKNHQVLRIFNGHPFPSDNSRLSQKDARQKLGLPEEGILALTVSQTLSAPRKGGNYLREMAKNLKEHDNFHWYWVGQDPPLPNPSPRQITAVGPLKRDMLALYYQAVDFLFHPAPSDNLPNVVVESLIHNCPVAALKVGGIPEMVIPGENGWLTDQIDSSSMLSLFHQAVKQLSDPMISKNMRYNSGQFANNNFTLEKQVASYESLFADLAEHNLQPKHIR